MKNFRDALIVQGFSLFGAIFGKDNYVNLFQEFEIHNMKILQSIILTSLVFILIAPSCKKEEAEEKSFDFELLKEQVWYFAGEETSGDTIYYRPETYDFPMSRGREGFKLKEEGKVLYHAISPTDFPMKFENAKWSFDDGVLTIEIPGNEYAQPRVLQYRILSLDKEKLKAIAIY